MSGKSKAFHTPKSPKGMGDFTGSGVKNPVGKVKKSYLTDLPTTKSGKKAPKTIA